MPPPDGVKEYNEVRALLAARTSLFEVFNPPADHFTGRDNKWSQLTVLAVTHYLHFPGGLKKPFKEIEFYTRLFQKLSFLVGTCKSGNEERFADCNELIINFHSQCVARKPRQVREHGVPLFVRFGHQLHDR